MKKYYLAIDLGASNGRGIVFSYDGERLDTVHIERFPNFIVTRNGTDYWDFDYLLKNVKAVLRETCRRYPIESFAIDTWGLDFGLLDAKGRLLDAPVSYRDGRTAGVPEQLYRHISQRELYFETGTQYLQGNTIYQLYALRLQQPELLEKADRLLMMPDLLTYFLTGKCCGEYTISSTTQMLNLGRHDWNQALLEKLDLPVHLLGNIVLPGEQAFEILDSVREELGLEYAPKIVTAASHDTASAVISVPTEEEAYLYVSSGTWSVLGTELSEPVICEEGFRGNFTNEGGFGGSIRYCRSLIGLWLIQECVRIWKEEGEEISYSQLTELIKQSEPLAAYFDPQHSSVQGKCHMPNAIAKLCAANGSRIPRTKGEFARCIYESIALNYRRTIESLEAQTGKQFTKIYIVGGGTRATFLNQCIANATGKTVIASMPEATAYGNAFVQLYYDGTISSVAQFRKMLSRSEKQKVYEPQDSEIWEKAYEVFLTLE